jgi:formyl-CoA transferase
MSQPERQGERGYTPALARIRVVELANFIAGPFIGMLLADYGADVVKVEQPQGGDGIRTWGNRKNGVGLYHKILNRNKRSVTADFGNPLGVEIVRRLVRNADVVIESCKPSIPAWCWCASRDSGRPVPIATGPASARSRRP